MAVLVAHSCADRTVSARRRRVDARSGSAGEARERTGREVAVLKGAPFGGSGALQVSTACTAPLTAPPLSTAPAAMKGSAAAKRRQRDNCRFLCERIVRTHLEISWRAAHAACAARAGRVVRMVRWRQQRRPIHAVSSRKIVGTNVPDSADADSAHKRRSAQRAVDAVLNACVGRSVSSRVRSRRIRGAMPPRRAALAAQRTRSYADAVCLVWFVLDAFTHLVIEASYVALALGPTAANSSSPFGAIWREYGRADKRWAGRDATVISLELLTVFIGGPASAAMVYAVLKCVPTRTAFDACDAPLRSPERA